jgi:hypothetical protein
MTRKDRFKKLVKLDEQIRSELLGLSGEEAIELQRLQRKVHAEIKRLNVEKVTV